MGLFDEARTQLRGVLTDALVRARDFSSLPLLSRREETL